MAADLGDFTNDETDTPLRSNKRRSFAAMGTHDNASPLTASPITAPTRTTPPHTALTLERPMLENFMTPSPASNNSPGMTAPRQYASLDHDIAKFVNSVNYLPYPWQKSAKLILFVLAPSTSCQCRILHITPLLLSRTNSCSTIFPGGVLLAITSMI